MPRRPGSPRRSNSDRLVLLASLGLDRLVLLASLGLDLTDPGIRAALVVMHQRHELRLASVGDVAAARALVDESAIVVGDVTLHAVVIS